MERWKIITDYPNYEVSDKGRVRNLVSNKVLRPGLSAGYPAVNLRKNNKSISVRVHRLVGQAFVDNPNKYNIINHIDHDKTNNHYTNLEWCTQHHNMLEAAKLGIGNSTFTVEQIIDIKQRLLNKERPVDIAAIYNTTPTTIVEIKKGKNKVAASLGIDTTNIVNLPKIMFTPAQILEVKAALAKGSTRNEIAKLTGIKLGSIHKIKSGVYDKYLV